jgi:hypothetical protein
MDSAQAASRKDVDLVTAWPGELPACSQEHAMK